MQDRTSQPLARSLLNVMQTSVQAEDAMGAFLPDYLIREQAAVGALVVFGVLRVIGAAIAFERGWRIATVERCFLAAALLYCAPQLLDLLTYVTSSHAAAAELEGKATGCAIGLFCAPIVGHKLGYE
jgi:membrane associated rhomboid family serine protease